MISFGQLKLSLIQKGVFISPDVIKAPEIAYGVCSEHAGEELSLALAENFIVKVLLQPVGKGCGKLSLQDGTTSLVSGTERIDVDIIPMPNFLKDHQKKKDSPFGEQLSGRLLPEYFFAGTQTEKPSEPFPGNYSFAHPFRL